MAQEAIDKIKRIQYVNIACLLPPKPGPATEPTPKRFRVDDDGALAVCAAPKRKIENLATWIEAWSLFSLIAIGAHHLCAEALMIHQFRIIQAAGKYRFAAVVEFDTRARQALSKDLSRSLADLDTELYTTCFTGQALPFCNTCKRLGHLTASCTTQPFRSRPKEQGVSSSAKPVRLRVHAKCRINVNIKIEFDEVAESANSVTCTTCPRKRPRAVDDTESD